MNLQNPLSIIRSFEYQLLETNISGSKQIPFKDPFCNFKRKQNERVSDVFRQMENAIFFHSLKTEEKEATANETFFSPHAKEAQKLRSAKTLRSVPSLSLLHALTHTHSHTLSLLVYHPLALKRIHLSLSK